MNPNILDPGCMLLTTDRTASFAVMSGVEHVMCVCVFVDAKEEISEILPLRQGEGGSSASGSTYPLATTP